MLKKKGAIQAVKSRRPAASNRPRPASQGAATTQMLKLADDLMPGIRDGAKRVTIRNGRRDIQLGRLRIEATQATEPTLHVNVSRVLVVPLHRVPQEALDGDGFTDAEEALEILRRFYQSITLESEVTVIEFEYIPE